MQPLIKQPLSESDFCDPHAHDLDEHHALATFLGKTADQAEAMFRRRTFFCYYEDLLSMRAPAFQYYLLPAIKYLLSDDANADPDSASTFCRVLESRMTNDPQAFSSIASTILEAVTTILENFDRFECSQDIYGDVPARYRAIVASIPNT